MSETIRTISLIGSGNVATHFALALVNAGCQALEVHSRNLGHASALASRIGARAVAELEQISPEADLYLLSTSDDAYPSIVSRFPHKGKLLAHTSGSLSSSILGSASPRHGTLYPFQTLSASKPLPFSQVPILYCGSDPETELTLKRLGERISRSCMKATDDQRKSLHIAAVFACNFVNHLYALAYDIVQSKDLSFELLRPLILETAEKALCGGNPASRQTGPAVRGDQAIIQSHLQMLQTDPGKRGIYELLSNSIHALDSSGAIR